METADPTGDRATHMIPQRPVALSRAIRQDTSLRPRLGTGVSTVDSITGAHMSRRFGLTIDELMPGYARLQKSLAGFSEVPLSGLTTRMVAAEKTLMPGIRSLSSALAVEATRASTAALAAKPPSAFADASAELARSLGTAQSMADMVKGLGVSQSVQDLVKSLGIAQSQADRMSALTAPSVRTWASLEALTGAKLKASIYSADPTGVAALADAMRQFEGIRAVQRQMLAEHNRWLTAQNTWLTQFDIPAVEVLRRFESRDTPVGRIRESLQPGNTDLIAGHSPEGIVPLIRPSAPGSSGGIDQVVATVLDEFLPGYREVPMPTSPDGPSHTSEAETDSSDKAGRTPALAAAGFRLLKETGWYGGFIIVSIGSEKATLLWTPQVYQQANQLLASHQIAITLITILAWIRSALHGGQGK